MSRERVMLELELARTEQIEMLNGKASPLSIALTLAIATLDSGPGLSRRNLCPRCDVPQGAGRCFCVEGVASRSPASATEIDSVTEAWAALFGVGPQARRTAAHVVGEVLPRFDLTPEGAAIAAVATRQGKANAFTLGHWLRKSEGIASTTGLRFIGTARGYQGREWWVEAVAR